MRNTKMMLLIKYGLFLMLVLSLSAISLNVQAKDSFVKVKTIIVNNYHPYTFMNDKGKPDGFSVEIARAVTRAMDLELNIHVDKWDQAMKELKDGSIDLLPMMAYSPERDKIFDFSVPHTIAYDAIFLKKGTTGIRSLNDLSGKTVILMNQDIAHSYLLSSGLSKTMILNLVNSLPEALKQLSEGKGDAAIMPKLVGILTLKKLHLLNIESSFLINRYTRPFSFAVKNDNQLLLERLNQGLSIIKSSGEYDSIYKKWFGALEDPNLHLKIAMKYGSIAALAFLGFIIWNVLLNRQVRRKTRELNQSNKELTEQGELLASIINGTTDTVYIKDTLGRYKVANDEMVRLFAKPLSDIIGHDDTHFFPPEEARFIMSGDKAIMEDGRVVTKEEHVTMLGSRKVYLATKGPIHDESGKVNGLFGISRDITKHKQAEESLKESEEKYRSIFENAVEGLFQSTQEGRFISVNPSFARMLGYASPEELVSSISDITTQYYANPEDWHRYKQLLQKDGLVEHFEFKAQCKDGSHIWVFNSTRAIYDQDGKITRYEGNVTDITERKQAEEEKIKAQKIAGEHKKLALVGQVAGKMAHDFNNILGIIMGNTELTLLDCQEPETRKTLELIFEQTIRGKNLTKNLVAFAKDQEPKQEFFRISGKIDLVLNLMRKDLEGIELRKEESPGVPELLADPGMIEHALVNLIQNSIHALSMVEHPRITLRTYSLDNKIC
ncbi:MAG: transporter substrate-binding domain-containing protein, partial [Desulfobacula sp.]|nr:transporter substrate-binding domain-containing protein [Desulfobacula sp.]